MNCRTNRRPQAVTANSRTTPLSATAEESEPGAWGGAIYARWKAAAQEPGYALVRDILGYPMSDEDPINEGKFNVFQAGKILWTPSTGAHEVHGSIATRYWGIGGPGSYLGFPITDEMAEGVASRNVRYSQFQHGWIYWAPEVGAMDTPKKVHNGLTFSGLEVPTWTALRDWTADSTTTPLYRRSVVASAFNEKQDHLCTINGDFPSRYCNHPLDPADCTGGWCTEFARYVLINAGMYDLSGYGGGSLGHATEVYNMEYIFLNNGVSPGSWVPLSNIGPYSFMPGDYLSVHDGNHSTIIVGVSFDRKKVWTVERNNTASGDCVDYISYDYMSAGWSTLMLNNNQHFYGVGQLRCNFFPAPLCP